MKHSHEPKNGEENGVSAVDPLGFQKERIECEKLEKKALMLVAELREKEEQEKKRCKHPSHPTYYVSKRGKCRKAWKCPDHLSAGCVATAT